MRAPRRTPRSARARRSRSPPGCRCGRPRSGRVLPVDHRDAVGALRWPRAPRAPPRPASARRRGRSGGPAPRCRCRSGTVWPCASSESLMAWAFSMIPLCTSAMRPVGSVWGWALTSLGTPWVAQRVWPMPTRPEKSAGVVARSAAILPFTLWIFRRALVEDGHAGRVVAPVLEAGQAVEHHGHRVPVPDASHDAAHAQ